MRAMRVVAATGLSSIALVVAASSGRADGGAYIDLNRTHYLPGQTAVAETYVTVPRSKQHLLTRGPFYAFLVTGRTWPQEGRPIPDDAVRVGTFTVEHDAGTTFELTAQLSIPDVAGDFYGLALCNDPCTVAGFREPISGTISIVQTAREAALLHERQRLEARSWHLRRELRRDARELDGLRVEFEARERDRAYLAAEVNRLNRALERASSSDGASRPLVDGWAAGMVGGLAAGATAVVLVRRRSHASSVLANPT
jgi:hypothetical protein